MLPVYRKRIGQRRNIRLLETWLRLREALVSETACPNFCFQLFQKETAAWVPMLFPVWFQRGERHNAGLI